MTLAHLLVLQVYAYTSSAVMRGVLDLFVRCEAVLPNLYIGTLTRDTVSAALARGLDAENLLTFLNAHAHPQAAQRGRPVPEVRWPLLRLVTAQQAGWLLALAVTVRWLCR